MKKREITTYMDAFMEGFWQCYDMMMDMMDDDEEPQVEPIQTDMTVQELFQKVADADSARRKTGLAPEQPKEEPKPEAPKPKIQKIDRGKVCALLDAGWKVPKIAGEMHASEATIYNIQKEYREQKAKQETQA